MKRTQRATTPSLTDQVQLTHSQIPAAFSERILELAENHVSEHTIASVLEVPLPLVRLVVRCGRT